MNKSWTRPSISAHRRLPTAPKPAFHLGFDFYTKSSEAAGPEGFGLWRAIFSRRRADPVNRSAPKNPGNPPLSAVLNEAGAAAMSRQGYESLVTALIRANNSAAR